MSPVWGPDEYKPAPSRPPRPTPKAEDKIIGSLREYLKAADRVTNTLWGTNGDSVAAFDEWLRAVEEELDNLSTTVEEDLRYIKKLEAQIKDGKNGQVGK